MNFSEAITLIFSVTWSIRN